MDTLKQIVIHFDYDTAAFGGGNFAAECARILRDLATSFDEGILPETRRETVFDVDGERIGEARIQGGA